MTEDKAREIAHGLIQGYIGQDHKVIDMRAFFSALVQALRTPSPSHRPKWSTSPRPNHLLRRRIDSR